MDLSRPEALNTVEILAQWVIVKTFTPFVCLTTSVEIWWACSDRW